jgi:hypothetical protein
MEMSYIEAWIRLLRLMYAQGRGGTERTTTVTVSSGYPFADAPENHNLPNDPRLADARSASLNRDSNRRTLQPPEVSVHDAGASFPQKYMDNYLGDIYSRDVVMPSEFLGKIANVKNVMLERKDGSLKVLEVNKHFKYDAERSVLTFLVEFFDYVPAGAKVQYTLELFSETLCGQNEIILNGVVEKGEIIGAVYSLEGDVTIQIDLWGSDPKQTEWLLQRFRNLWINERKLRRSLAAQGLLTMNLSWSHSGIVKNLDSSLRPYLYNIPCLVKFTTEYRVMELVSSYVYDIDEFAAGSNWLGNISAIGDAPAIREVAGDLALTPFRLRMMVPWTGEKKLLNENAYGVYNTLGYFTY